MVVGSVGRAGDFVCEYCLLMSLGDSHACIAVARSTKDRNNDSVEACLINHHPSVLVCASTAQQPTTKTRTHRWDNWNERKALHHNTSISAYQRERESPLRHTSARQHSSIYICGYSFITSSILVPHPPILLCHSLLR